MRNYIIIFLVLFSFTLKIDAQWVRQGPSRKCWCCCYMDPTYANYDGILYGYTDRINYPDRYDLPVNRCFNFCMPCPGNSYNIQYFRNCVRYTRQHALLPSAF